MVGWKRGHLARQQEPGGTPVFSAEEARRVIDAIDTGHITGLRDRALIGVMIYSFARVSAVVAMRVRDYFPNGKRWWFRPHKKGGKLHDVPAHHKAEEYMDAYLEAAGIASDKKGPLFLAINKHRELRDQPMSRHTVLKMIQRRTKAAGLPETSCNHTFRATGITVQLDNGGRLEDAQAIAGHASTRTTKLYDRRGDVITQEAGERVVI